MSPPDGTSGVPPPAGVRSRVARRRSPEHPAERIARHGARALALRELLVLVLDAGRGEVAAEGAADAVLAAFRGPGEDVSLRRIAARSPAAVHHAAGIAPRLAARLAAALELGRRGAEEHRIQGSRIRTARDVYEYFRLKLRDLPQEEFHVLLLGRQGDLLRDVTVAVGTLDESICHARDVFRSAVTEGAYQLVLAHNHPSGNPAPSSGDHRVTRVLAAAGDVLGIEVRDHVVIGEEAYFSFHESGLLQAYRGGA